MLHLIWSGLELPNVPVFALMSDMHSETRMAMAYIFLGGATYAIIGFVIGSIALLYRPRPK
jgi:hypothetical protein